MSCIEVRGGEPARTACPPEQRSRAGSGEKRRTLAMIEVAIGHRDTKRDQCIPYVIIPKEIHHRSPLDLRRSMGI